MSPPPGALEGIRVLDVATLFAGPLAARILGDHGAEVIKVEHPRGDPARTHGHRKHGHGLWWKVLARNKRAITLDLSKPQGQELLRGLVAKSDVLIENFRPGVMERWGLGWEALSAVNPRLVMLRVTGFGQLGPYATRPGFGTLAEAMSGFAYITGQPDGPPTLPPFGLADGIAGLAGAAAVMMALYHRDLHGAGGQMIDLAIIEPILHVRGAQPTVYDQLGVIQQRTGNRSANNAPRNTYRTRDGRWVAISTSADRVAERVMRLVGHPEVVEEPWFATGGERAAHAEELDRLVGDWVAGRSQEEVIAAFTAAGAAVAPIYDVTQVLEDPQYRALKSIVRVEDEDLGPIRMQNQLFRMTATPGRIRFTGRRLGQDNEAIYTGLLGLASEELAKLKRGGVI
jgi:crotonobetainyl-CoA:carnitine CoA-transferase CaiB-like acyl-CoA transferase